MAYLCADLVDPDEKATTVIDSVLVAVCTGWARTWWPVTLTVQVKVPALRGFPVISPVRRR